MKAVRDKRLDVDRRMGRMHAPSLTHDGVQFVGGVFGLRRETSQADVGEANSWHARRWSGSDLGAHNR